VRGMRQCRILRLIAAITAWSYVCSLVTPAAFGFSPRTNGNTTQGEIRLGFTGAETAPQNVTDTYDAENRLTTRQSSTGPGVTLVYDGDGNKVREIVNGQTISYLIDTLNPTGYAQVVEELQNGTVVRTYTYGHDLLLQDQRDAGGTWNATWFGYDGHGSVRFLTDGAAQITDRYDYDAFGALLHAEGPTFNRYRYCGEQFDGNLGLYYLRARFLDAANGRFWSMDSYEGGASDPQSLHKYLYCSSAPTNQSDPSGCSPATLGTAVHQFLAAEFISESFAFGYETPLTNRAVRTVIRRLFNLRLPNVSPLRDRPDLINTLNSMGFVYEVKPGVVGDVLENIAVSSGPQLLGYIALLQAFTPPGGLTWHRGMWWTANTGGWRIWSSAVIPGAPPGTVLVTFAEYASAPGAIIYQFLPLPTAAVQSTGAIRVGSKGQLSLALQDSRFASAFGKAMSQTAHAATIAATAVIVSRIALSSLLRGY
jgi:RHS repeat-associated protein